MPDPKNDPLFQILKKQGKLTDIQLSTILQSHPQHVPIQICQELIKKNVINAEDLHHALALQFEIDICLEPAFTLPKEVYKIVSYPFAKKHLALPLRESEGLIHVAVADPLNLNAIEELHFLLNLPLKMIYCPKETLVKAIDKCYHHEEGAASQLLAHLADHSLFSQEEDDMQAEDLLDDRQQAPIIKLLNLIITEAIQQGASDIHIEPFENDFIIRYRIDGILLKRHAPPREYQSPLITRIKVMAKLDIAEHRLPQDGRLKLKMGGRDIDFRVSTIPVSGGERIVMRILDKGNIILGLDQLGMPAHLLQNFQKLVASPEGIVLVTGPTGSGKTTTLYSAICELHSPEINIMTIEDPVEYKLPGISQMGVQPKIKLDFVTGLRHILRQDPDVILIGEIRDRETAEIAIQASLTGHLVLSTLHTNDAPSAITRLVDMGIESYLLSSSIVGVLAQRLLRTICPFCRMDYEPSDKELAELQIDREELLDGTISKGKGCPQCFGSGYKGRRGIYELMPFSNPVKRQAIKSADSVELRKIAIEQGMTSLKQHGAELVRNGVTTTSEVLRVAH